MDWACIWHRRLLLLLTLLAAGGLAAAADQPVHLTVDAPRDGEVLNGPVAFVEVAGWASARATVGHDVVLVLDVSDSTLLPAGIDVDGDGETGILGCFMHGRNPLPGMARRRFPCPEARDTIRAAELVAARSLIERLDPQRTRVGIVTFAGKARVAAPLDRSRGSVLATLHRINPGARARTPGTDFGLALRTALAHLADTPRPDGTTAQQVILFLSDGEPTLPGVAGKPARAALEAAERAQRAGVRIHSFALGGPASGEDLSVFRALAERSDGRFTRLERPAEIVVRLPGVDLADLAQVSMRNLTSGGEGRAVRLLPDGFFDGFVPLIRGLNRLRVTARSRSGAVTTIERRVLFDPLKLEGDAEEGERFAERLRARRVETEELRAILEVQRQRREIEVRAEEASDLWGNSE